MTILTAILSGWILVSTIMLLCWFLQRNIHDAGIVDVAWAANLALLALLYALSLDGDPMRRYLLLALAGIWYLRLALYLLLNRVIGKEEDGRYQRLRQTWQGNIQGFFFGFFQLQAVLDVILSLSFLAVAVNPTPLLTFWDTLAIALFALAWLGESLADYQLARFRANPAHQGQTCRVGLWKYSRHPNYFFEWLHWWIYPLLAIGTPWFWGTLLAPALMLYFILYVTGIPPTEARALQSRGEDYKNYQKTTSAFIPWFPKQTGESNRPIN